MSARIFSSHTIRAHTKPLAAFAVSLVFALATLPAFAQQQQAPNVPAQPYVYGHHLMWGGHGWHPFMIVGPIFVLLAIIGTMAIFVWLVRWASHGYPFLGQGLHHGGFHHGGCPCCGGRAALDILDERFARGEIEKAEFEEKRKLLGR